MSFLALTVFLLLISDLSQVTWIVLSLLGKLLENLLLLLLLKQGVDQEPRGLNIILSFLRFNKFLESLVKTVQDIVDSRRVLRNYLSPNLGWDLIWLDLLLLLFDYIVVWSLKALPN